ncbi:MAG: imidazoleglycerol-phosphate dehydratase HisB, partial [Candidatus Didemnitutus sp.]|nr:imidazoleglycerol-phosphate dehydratase HisB [Candidatus Didemnitutus sp.]
DKMLKSLAQVGGRIDAIFFCPHTQADNCECRKPKPGLLLDYLRDPTWDRAASAVIGDRETDVQLAAALGVAGLRYDPAQLNWTEIARRLIDAPRRATIVRRTKETNITVSVDLDTPGPAQLATGIGFFDHLLDQIAKNAAIGLSITCEGDLEIDEHHTVEDVGLALGQALRQALGDKRGVGRYGFVLPMDEACAQVALDLSGRAYFVFEGKFTREMVGELPTELVPHFFRSLSDALAATLHMRVTGENNHHLVETLFKGFGRALRPAIARSGDGGVPSTKGVL